MPADKDDLFRELAPNTGWQLASGGIDASVTTIPLVSAANLPTGTAVTLTIDRRDSSKKETPELMERITGVVDGSDIVDCIRGVEGVAQPHRGGAVVEIVISAELWNDVISGILIEHSQDGKHIKATGAEVNRGTEENKVVTPESIGDSYLAGQRHGLARQALINGNFDVAQRGTAFTSATTPANNDDTYLIDRWNLISDGNDAVDVSQEEVTDIPGSQYALKLDTETSKRYGIVQILEKKDAAKLKGKYVSLSLAVKSTNISALRAAVLSWGGTADEVTSDIVSAWAATPTWAANWTAENTPADLVVSSGLTTVKIENIYIDSAVVNNLAVAIWTPNEEAIGDIVYITQVQLCEGPVALPFQPKSFEEELESCKRYFEKSYDYSVAPGTNNGNGVVSFIAANADHAIGSCQFRVPKRATPTVKCYSPSGAVDKIRIWSSGSDISVTSTSNGLGQKNLGLITTASGLSTGSIYSFHFTAESEL
ncbi:MAG: hypothetical protein HGA33_06095 [Candidatus Moranbacteria bacterium]|nr:hypothetical protein [Candidatus Moranbacteria bacterium]